MLVVMGVHIVPAVLPASREDLERQLQELSGITDSIQLNVVDGKYIGPATWPYSSGRFDLSHMAVAGEMLPQLDEFRYEIDLLVSDAEDVVGQWISVGASRITIHVESTKYLPKILEELARTYGHDKDFVPDMLAIGLGLSVETDIGVVDQYLESIDYVSFLGVARPGKQGEPFDPSVLDRIKAFRKKHPSVAVQVDGGVSRATAPALLDLGVSRLVVGSDLWRAEDRKERYGELVNLIECYGIYE